MVNERCEYWCAYPIIFKEKKQNKNKKKQVKNRTNNTNDTILFIATTDECIDNYFVFSVELAT